MTYQNKCKVDMRWLKAYHFNRKAITDFNWDYLECSAGIGHGTDPV